MTYNEAINKCSKDPTRRIFIWNYDSTSQMGKLKSNRRVLFICINLVDSTLEEQDSFLNCILSLSSDMRIYAPKELMPLLDGSAEIIYYDDKK